MLHKTTDSQHRKMKQGRYVSGSLKLLHNSNILQIAISGIPVPCRRGFSNQERSQPKFGWPKCLILGE